MPIYSFGASGGPRGSHEPSTACLDQDGNILFILEEERFNRFKSSISCFPTHSLRYVFNKFPHLLNSIRTVSHPGATYKDMHQRWPLYFQHNFGLDTCHRYFHHQLCHASSAYYSSPFDRALVVSLDGVGDNSSGCVAIAEDHKLIPLCFFSPTQSLGFFWSFICQLIGYDGLEDAYKTMGLAPYGTPKYDLSELISYSEGNFSLSETYFADKYKFISKHPSEPVYDQLLPCFMKGIPLRKYNQPITQTHMDIAASAQKMFEDLLLRFFDHYAQKTRIKNLCFAGGTALNSHFNGLLGDSNIFDKIYIPPLAGDSGLALGAAQLEYARSNLRRPQPINSPYLGSDNYDESDLSSLLDSLNLKYRKTCFVEVSHILNSAAVIGFFSGRAEAGPRALGNRSILASPRSHSMKDIVNSKIKYRESYRPFAPVILPDFYDEYFYPTSCNLEYMTAVVKAKKIAFENCPAVVHIDGTSRVQLATPGSAVYSLLSEFYNTCSIPVLLNTSFNLKGEPNVESPRDAIRTFYSSGLDHLVIWPFILSK